MTLEKLSPDARSILSSSPAGNMKGYTILQFRTNELYGALQYTLYLL